MGNLVEHFVQHPMCGILDNDIELVRDEPNAKHKIRALILQQCDNINVLADRNDFFALGWRHGVELNLDELHVVLSDMSFEEWNEDKVKVVEHAFHAHTNSLIKERNTQMSDCISS